MSQRDTKFDTRLLIHRARQIILGVIVAINVIGFTLFIREGIENDHSWVFIGIPLCLLGCIYLIYPSTEEWEYAPWQSRPQQIEQSSQK